MTLFKHILVGSLVYGTLALSTLAKMGDPNIPRALHNKSGLNKLVSKQGFNTLSMQDQIIGPEV